jgi:hypothetical protein
MKVESLNKKDFFKKLIINLKNGNGKKKGNFKLNNLR